MNMDRKNEYKKMMEQIEPERELKVEDLTHPSAVRKRSAGRYLLVLVPAALAVIAALVLSRGLFNGKTPEDTLVPVAVSDEPEKTVSEKPSEEKESTTSGPETASSATEKKETESPIIIVDKKQQAVGAVRLYFDQMEKDLKEYTTAAFMAKYPETGEAYRKYYEYLHSDNPWWAADMVYAWFTPGHPEEKDGDYLLLGIRVKTDVQGTYDNLNDEAQPGKGEDPGNPKIHGWSYILNYLYHYDERSGALVPVAYPGKQIYLCLDFTFLAIRHDVEFHLEDGRVLGGEEMVPYYDEKGGYTIPVHSDRQTETYSYFTIDEAGELVVEGQYIVMDVTFDRVTNEPAADLASAKAKAAADALWAAHGVLEPLSYEDLLDWHILSES